MVLDETTEEGRPFHIGIVLGEKRLFQAITITKKPTLFTPSFGNHLFANYHVLKHPLPNLILSSFYFLEVLKSAANIMEIGSQIKNLMPKNNLGQGFFHCENVAKGSHYFPRNKTKL